MYAIYPISYILYILHISYPILSYFYFPFICRVANITRVSVYQAAVEQQKAIKGWPGPPSVSSGSTIMTALYRFTRFNRVASLSFWNFRAKSCITLGQNRTWKTKNLCYSYIFCKLQATQTKMLKLLFFFLFGPSHYHPSAMELVCTYFALICYSDPCKTAVLPYFRVLCVFYLILRLLFPFLVWKKPWQTFSFGVFPVLFESMHKSAFLVS